MTSLRSQNAARAEQARARTAGTPIEDLRTMMTSDDLWLRHAVAQNPQVPVDILVTLSADPSGRVRSAVASHPDLPADLLPTLATDADQYVRSAVAKHPATDAETLSRLSTDPEKWVRLRVAQHPATPDEALVRFCSDPDDGVRRALSQRNPPAHSRTVEVRRFNGRNSHNVMVQVPVEEAGRFGPEVLWAMGRSDSNHLKALAAAQPDAPAELLAEIVAAVQPETSLHWILERIAENPGASEAVLELLISPSGGALMITIAARPGVSPSLIEAILRVAHPRTQRKVVALCGMGEPLSSSADPALRRAVARSLADMSPETAEALLRDPAKAVRVDAAKNCALGLLSAHESEFVEVRRVIAERATDSDTLHRLASDSEASVRRRVAQNPRASASSLSLLAADPDDATRALAAERFMQAMSTP